ncbi:MAG: hypothetical protein ACUVQ4_09780 [bacterium]
MTIKFIVLVSPGVLKFNRNWTVLGVGQDELMLKSTINTVSISPGPITTLCGLLTF